MSEKVVQSSSDSKSDKATTATNNTTSQRADDTSQPIQVPIPSTSAAITKILETPATKVTADECRQILAGLEKRIATCEKFIGDPRVISEGISQSEKEGEESDGVTAAAFDPLDSRQKEWIRDVEFSINDKTPLVTQIERVRRLTDQIFHGRPSELEKKLNNLKSWMDAENANVSQLLLSHQAKKASILQNEDRIREMALLLKQVEELKDYVNHSTLANLSSCRPRIDSLEHQGQGIAERAKRLYSDLEELSLSYSNAMSVLCSVLADAARKSSNNLQTTKSGEGTSPSKRRVGFSD